jgi:hypothetical protein
MRDGLRVLGRFPERFTKMSRLSHKGFQPENQPPGKKEPFQYLRFQTMNTKKGAVRRTGL